MKLSPLFSAGPLPFRGIRPLATAAGDRFESSRLEPLGTYQRGCRPTGRLALASALVLAPGLAAASSLGNTLSRLPWGWIIGVGLVVGVLAAEAPDGKPHRGGFIPGDGDGSPPMGP
jgi:hypothetical protein